MSGGTHATAHTLRLEANMWVSLLSFYYVGSRDRTQAWWPVSLPNRTFPYNFEYIHLLVLCVRTSARVYTWRATCRNHFSPRTGLTGDRTQVGRLGSKCVSSAEPPAVMSVFIVQQCPL